MAKANDWWTDFFPIFRPFFDIVPTATSRAEVGYIIKKLSLKKGSRFLDCPCGIGRITIPLARKGIRVTGVDITRSYLDELAAKSHRLKLPINVVHSDMRRIKFDREFDAAGNLGTSFGYFEKESDNELVLKKIFRALKPGGKFMLNVANRDWIIRNYAAVGLEEAGKIRIIQKRQFDQARSIITADWTFLKDGQEKTVRSVLRMYSYHELINMMNRAGFIDIEGFGSTKSEPIDFNRRNMFIMAIRPK
jgi:ubiquinone/menaquinone biosynthesis C-methylase UbiE